LGFLIYLNMKGLNIILENFINTQQHDNSTDLENKDHHSPINEVHPTDLLAQDFIEFNTITKDHLLDDIIVKQNLNIHPTENKQ
jgi:hypothetical protein